MVRILCYLALAVVGAATVIAGFLDVSGICPNISETGLHCKVRALESVGNVAFGIVIMSVFTIVPATLATPG